VPVGCILTSFFLIAKDISVQEALLWIFFTQLDTCMDIKYPPLLEQRSQNIYLQKTELPNNAVD
jgi:hypothetical protein